MDGVLWPSGSAYGRLGGGIAYSSVASGNLPLSALINLMTDTEIGNFIPNTANVVCDGFERRKYERTSSLPSSLSGASTAS